MACAEADKMSAPLHEDGGASKVYLCESLPLPGLATIRQVRSGWNI